MVVPGRMQLDGPLNMRHTVWHYHMHTVFDMGQVAPLTKSTILQQCRCFQLDCNHSRNTCFQERDRPSMASGTSTWDLFAPPLITPPQCPRCDHWCSHWHARWLLHSPANTKDIRSVPKMSYSHPHCAYSKSSPMLYTMIAISPPYPFQNGALSERAIPESSILEGGGQQNRQQTWPFAPQQEPANLLAVLTVRGRSRAGFCLKNDTGLRWKPTVSTGITGKSSGRTRCVAPVTRMACLCERHCRRQPQTSFLLCYAPLLFPEDVANQEFASCGP